MKAGRGAGEERGVGERQEARVRGWPAVRWPARRRVRAPVRWWVRAPARWWVRAPVRWPARWRDRVGDGGLATVWAAVTTATLCTVFAVVLALGQVVAARHRAGGAADLAALAAADRALEGEAEACRSAREVAGAQGAEVVRCVVQGEVADVTAKARFGPYAPVVRARAGPAATASPAPPPVTLPSSAGWESRARPGRVPVRASPARQDRQGPEARTGGAL